MLLLWQVGGRDNLPRSVLARKLRGCGGREDMANEFDRVIQVGLPGWHCTLYQEKGNQGLSVQI